MLVPPEKEDAAAAMFRAAGDSPDDVAVARIHRFIWPQGTTSCSVPMLRTLLRAICAARDVAEPSDDLPDDLGKAITDVEAARDRLMDEIRNDASEGGTQPQRYIALARLVKVQIEASKHRIELQSHRAALADAARAAGRSRTPA